MNDNDTQPVSFEEPKIVDYGDLADITAGQRSGTHLDASFPVGTPASGITFS